MKRVDDFRFKLGGKELVPIVTGGMGGLGETISTKMSDAGYRVVVIEAGRTRRDTLVQAVERLRNSNAQIFGAVINPFFDLGNFFSTNLS